MDKVDRERLEALIASIVRDKIEDGQFDACGLTFRDVKGISDSFLHVLTAMLHGRIDYPTEPPRTASGRPMDVVREDLRPEPPELTLPLAVTQSEVGGDALAFLVPGPDLDRDADMPSGAVVALNTEEIPTAVTNSVLSEGLFASAMDMERPSVPTLPSHRHTFVEPEVLYGRLSAEHAIAPDSDVRSAPDGPPPAAGGRLSEGGSERSADR
jgi:hypothetical protein